MFPVAEGKIRKAQTRKERNTIILGNLTTIRDMLVGLADYVVGKFCS